MGIGNYNALIIKACNAVRRNKGINVSFNSNSFYGVHKYSQENVYKLDLNIDNEIFTLYIEEYAFESWTYVPWSGREEFRPTNFESWPTSEQLFLAWCWAIYNYCKRWEIHHEGPTPPPLEE